MARSAASDTAVKPQWGGCPARLGRRCLSYSCTASISVSAPSSRLASCLGLWMSVGEHWLQIHPSSRGSGSAATPLPHRLGRSPRTFAFPDSTASKPPSTTTGPGSGPPGRRSQADATAIAVSATKQQRPPHVPTPWQIAPGRSGLRCRSHDTLSGERDHQHLAVAHHARLVVGPFLDLSV